MTPHCKPTGKFPAPTTEKRKSALTVLSYGIGQDSWAILVDYAYNPQFRARFAPGRFLVVSSETSDEHDETYKHLKYSQEFCRRHGIEYVHITPDMGFHPRTWPGLREQYRRNRTCGAKGFKKSCTDNLKIVPIYNFLDFWVGKTWNLPSGRKDALKLFAQKYGKIDVLIGLAKGEEKRCAKPKVNDSLPLWRKSSIRIVYPLIEMKRDRAGCQSHVRSLNEPVPWPSNCKLCPYLSEQELLWLFRNCPEDFYDWVEIEANKLEKNKHMGEKNFGVFGKRTLTQALEDAEAKYGHWTKEQLDDWKFSHGHCVSSQY